jgi:hypothetical protein
MEPMPVEWEDGPSVSRAWYCSVRLEVSRQDEERWTVAAYMNGVTLMAGARHGSRDDAKAFILRSVAGTERA